MLFLVAATALRAHDSPDQVVKDLTERLNEEGPSAELLYRRAVELRVLGERNKAAQDLRKAVAMDPHLTAAWVEWTKVLLDEGQPEEALQAVNQGLRLTEQTNAKASLWRARAEVQFSRGEFAKALVDCHEALQAHPGDLDAYLWRGQLQTRLGRLQEAADGLHEGFIRTGSYVLKSHWIEALIDAGACRQAMPEIEKELSQARWKSSWLLRRARARLCLQNREAAASDLSAAIEEINTRLNPDRLDPTLLADRGLAYALSGKTHLARLDLREAERRKAEPWVLERLRTILANKDPIAPPAAGRSAQR